MTLDEAIKHAEEVADGYDRIKQIKAVTLEECKCASEHRQLAEWLKELEQLREQTRWIPVSEELPKKNGYYLTTTMYHKVYCDYWEEDSFNRTEAVIAWMPLPAPYESQESEDKE